MPAWPFVFFSDGDGRFWRKAAVRTNVRSAGQSGKHLLAMSISGFDPKRASRSVIILKPGCATSHWWSRRNQGFFPIAVAFEVRLNSEHTKHVSA
jgi:hypothetical protein